MRLAGKVALISGGARGMGAGDARLFAAYLNDTQKFLGFTAPAPSAAAPMCPILDVDTSV